MSEPQQYRLISVNIAPERAKRLIGRVIEDVKDRYDITHVANVESECMSIWIMYWNKQAVL